MADNSPSLGGNRQDQSSHLTGNEPMLEGALLQLPLEELIKKMDDRQRRLFACDCTEKILPFLEAKQPKDRRAHQAIEIARRFATGNASAHELRVIHNKVERAIGGFAANRHPVGDVFRAATAITALDILGAAVYSDWAMGALMGRYSRNPSAMAADRAAGYAAGLISHYAENSQ